MSICVRVVLAILAASLLTSTALPILLPSVEAAPIPAQPKQGASHQQDAIKAQQLNKKYAELKMTDTCTGMLSQLTFWTQSSRICTEPYACIDSGFAQCSEGKWVKLGCGAGTQCYGMLTLRSSLDLLD
jgi:hypothetical protein